MVKKIKADTLPLTYIKEYLIEDRSDLEPISDWSIRLILKLKLKYTYKKMCFIPTRSLSSDNFRMFWEFDIALVQLDNLGYKIIFLDEFSVNFLQNTIYGWTHIGEKEYINSNIETLSM